MYDDNAYETYHADAAEYDADFYPEDEDESFTDEELDRFERDTLGLSDVEADADTLASAGYGTDEDYGDYGQYDAGDYYGE